MLVITRLQAMMISENFETSIGLNQRSSSFCLSIKEKRAGIYPYLVLDYTENLNPKSSFFTPRCLRSISNIQQEGMVYLSGENIKTLENELEQNFKLTVDELTSAGDKKEIVEIRLTTPKPVKIKFKNKKASSTKGKWNKSRG